MGKERMMSDEIKEKAYHDKKIVVVDEDLIEDSWDYRQHILAMRNKRGYRILTKKQMKEELEVGEDE
jgi:hypothetical protein